MADDFEMSQNKYLVYTSLCVGDWEAIRRILTKGRGERRVPDCEFVNNVHLKATAAAVQMCDAYSGLLAHVDGWRQQKSAIN